MNEVVSQLRSVRLLNERLIWVRPPRDPSSAKHVSIFLDGEFYRDQVGANSMIDGLHVVLTTARRTVKLTTRPENGTQASVPGRKGPR